MSSRFEYIFERIKEKVDAFHPPLNNGDKLAFLNEMQPALGFNISEKPLDSFHAHSSKVGGMPCLPNGYSWPEIDGQKLVFVAQINFSDIRSFGFRHGLPSNNMFYFFMKLVEEQKYKYLDHTKSKYFVLELKEDYSRKEESDLPIVIQESFLEFSEYYTLPDLEELMLEDYFEDYDDFNFSYYEPLEELLDELTGHGADSYNQMLGNPRSVQAYVKSIFASQKLLGMDSSTKEFYENLQKVDNQLPDAAKAFKLLLQLDAYSLNPMMKELGHGTYYFGIEKQDLDTSNFNRLSLVNQNT